MTRSLVRMTGERKALRSEIRREAEKTRGPLVALRKRLARWKARIRGMVAELGILDRSRPARVFA